jgi:hypothetical protein
VDKNAQDKQASNSVAVILAGGMIAAAIVFAALHVGNQLQACKHESRALAPTSAEVADESESDADASDDETALREEAIKQQLTEQLSAAGIELTELGNYRVTHNEKMIALDLACKAKDGQAQQTCKDVELKEDELGRYTGKLTVAGKTVAIVIY